MRKAIESVLAQTYRDWRLIVADNASTDATPEIVREYCKRDARISLARHQENIGAIANFCHCVSVCPLDVAYFVWFAHDDIWEPDFLLSTAGRLVCEPNASLAWTNVYALDAYDQCQGRALGYSRYAGRPIATAARYVMEHEACGKAMLIHSVFRVPILRAALAAVPASYRGANWDNVLNLACVSRGSLIVDEQHLFGKRAPRQVDALGHFEPWHISFDRRLGLRSADWNQYFDALRSVVAGTRYCIALQALIAWRRYTAQYLVPRKVIAASNVVIDAA